MPSNPNPTSQDGPKAWLQINISTTTPQLAEELLWAHGAQAVTLRDAANQPLLEPLPGELPLWDAVRVTGLFDGQLPAAPLLERLQQALNPETTSRLDSELIEDRAWVRAWMDHFEPLRCGQRLWVCPSHRSVDAAGAIVLRLDPGLAFGTGGHPTTALCLRWLDQAQLAGKTVIDYGCGSGILAVAAALLGAEQVLAVDIDPQALDATRNNAKLNQVDAKIKTCLPAELPAAVQADLVLANILAGPLVQLAPVLLAHMRKSAQLVLAGLLTEQAGEVIKAYRQHTAIKPVFSLDGWQLLVAEKSS